MSRTVGIVLAAGASSRMGSPKALLDLDGRPLINVQISTLAARCSQVIVVLGAYEAQIRAVLPSDVQIVHNPLWAETGPAESLRCALAGLAEEDVALVNPVDTPPAPAWVLDALLAAGAPAIPLIGWTDGHPALIVVGPARAGLATGTLRDVARAAQRVPVDWPDGALNLNTPQDWAGWLRSRAGP